MKIKIERTDDAYQMTSTNEGGLSVVSDGSEAIGGHNSGMRPMEMVIASLGSCSSIDVITFLKKMRQPLDDIKIEIDAEREKDVAPAVFTKIHMHFRLFGEIEEKKAEKAITMSVDKYCSVARMLEKTAEISWSYSINE